MGRREQVGRGRAARAGRGLATRPLRVRLAVPPRGEGRGRVGRLGMDPHLDESLRIRRLEPGL